MSQRHCPRLTLSVRAILGLSLACLGPVAMAAQAAYGIHVHAACQRAAGTTTRLLADLSCESAMACWGEPQAITLLDATTGKSIGSAPGDLIYVDADGNVRADPPMQGTIRAIWAVAIPVPVVPAYLQLTVDGVAVTASFKTAADCAALPAGAVRRLSGG